MSGLWKSDGSEGGTVQVADINSIGHGYDIVRLITEFEGELFFTGYDGSSEGIWRSDGTESGTEKVIDISVPDLEYPWLQSEGDSLFFCNDDLSHGYEYWMGDGTMGGSGMIKNIGPGKGYSCSYTHFGIRMLSGEYYFEAYDGIHGWELWKSDGTEPGTKLVKDINLSGGSVNGGISSGNHIGINELLFPAVDDTHGRELWKTNGLEGGTAIVQDISSGLASSNPQGMTISGNNVIFFADDGIHGYELWILPLIPQINLTLSGSDVGKIGKEYKFIVESYPSDVTTPITYEWQATDQSEEINIGGNTASISFTWGNLGEKIVSVTASNLVNSVEAELTILILEDDIALETMTLSGDEECTVGEECVFDSTVSPQGATSPVTYEWQATDQVDVTHTGGVSDTVTFVWDTPGTKVVSVTANNGVNELFKQVEIEISEQLVEVFIPIVMSK